MTLTDFLLARIGEDEATAATDRLAAMAAASPLLSLLKALSCEGTYDYQQAREIAHAKRVLAECEAKRRIVEMAADAEVEGGGYEDAWTQVARLLALPYADHPDYRDEWRP